MVRALLGLCALGCAAAKSADLELGGYTFEQYLKDFEKSYSSSELAQREAIFQANLKVMMEHNSQGGSWYMAPNRFMDMTNGEFRQNKGYYAVPENLGAVKHQMSNVQDLPSAVDWRTKPGVVTPVKNQGGCGSCWAFASTEVLESHVAIATGKPAPILAPQQLVSCAKNPLDCGGTGGCGGATQEIALNYTAHHGLSLETSFPYQGSDSPCDASKLQPVAGNTGFVKLDTNNYTQLLDALATKGPVAISVAAGSAAFQLYGGGVYSGSVPCGMDVDHVVMLVGYGTDSGKDYWTIRNSWGPSWGENGYIRIERFGEGKEPCEMDPTPQDGNACKGDTAPKLYCGLCGVLSDAAYPVGARAIPAEISV